MVYFKGLMLFLLGGIPAFIGIAWYVWIRLKHPDLDDWRGH